MLFTLLKWFTCVTHMYPSILLSVHLWLKLGQLFSKVHTSNLLILYNHI